MSFPALIGPLTSIIDKIIPDKAARERAKIELIRLGGTHELETVKMQLSALVAAAGAPDRGTSRGRPSCRYVLYALLLLARPVALTAAVRPEAARDMAAGMIASLAGLPEPLYALSGTGYLGYTAARQWGKVKGVER